MRGPPGLKDHLKVMLEAPQGVQGLVTLPMGAPLKAIPMGALLVVLPIMAPRMELGPQVALTVKLVVLLEALHQTVALLHPTEPWGPTEAPQAVVPQGPPPQLEVPRLLQAPLAPVAPQGPTLPVLLLTYRNCRTPSTRWRRGA